MMDLPYQDFKWLDRKSKPRAFRTFEKQLLEGKYPNLSGSKSRKKKGFIAEVDLHLPKHLHQKFNEFPLAPVVRQVDPEELSSPQFNQFYSVYGDLPKRCSNDKGNKKLIGDLYPKQKYILHHKLLKFLLEEGYICTAVHRVMTCLLYTSPSPRD